MELEKKNWKTNTKISLAKFNCILRVKNKK